MSRQIAFATVASTTLAFTALLLPSLASACSSCGLHLNSDWASQGDAADAPLRFDLRFDFYHQNQLRSGTGTVNRADIALPTEREVQVSTVNRALNFTLDYSASKDWGFNVQLPVSDRPHVTIAEGDTETSGSRTSGLGDIRVLGRYQGLLEEHNLGLQAGLKLPTGKKDDTFRSGPQQGEIVDRGLQVGSGTTDLLLGAFYYGALSAQWQYFTQGLVQVALAPDADFQPGVGLNLNAGLRYVGNEKIVPHLQINLRIEGRERGAAADKDNSGATLAYLSPGVTWAVTQKAQVYGFVQVPFYQRVNGLQIEPRYSVSVGVRYAL